MGWRWSEAVCHCSMAACACSLTRILGPKYWAVVFLFVSCCAILQHFSDSCLSCFLRQICLSLFGFCSFLVFRVYGSCFSSACFPLCILFEQCFFHVVWLHNHFLWLCGFKTSRQTQFVQRTSDDVHSLAWFCLFTTSRSVRKCCNFVHG